MNCQIHRPNLGDGIYVAEVNKVTWYGQCLYGKAYGMGAVEYFKGRRIIATYKGEMNHGMAQGKGTFEIKRSSRVERPRPLKPREYLHYEGQFRGNNYNGQGTLHFANGVKHMGHFKNNKLQHGTIIDNPDMYGKEYTGQLRNGKYHGKGTLRLDSGFHYSGQFRNGKMHGQFTIKMNFMNLWKTFRYSCRPQNTESSSSGLPSSRNGLDYIKFIGQFQDNKPIGEGSFFLPDGTVHTGRWNCGNE